MIGIHEHTVCLFLTNHAGYDRRDTKLHSQTNYDLVMHLFTIESKCWISSALKNGYFDTSGWSVGDKGTTGFIPLARLEEKFGTNTCRAISVLILFSTLLLLILNISKLPFVCRF